MTSRPLDWPVTAALFVLLASGCTAHELSRNTYEGIKTHDESLKSTPLERSGAPSPGYVEYERERRALSPREAELMAVQFNQVQRASRSFDLLRGPITVAPSARDAAWPLF